MATIANTTLADVRGMGMDRIVMDDIPFVLDINLLVNALRLKSNLAAECYFLKSCFSDFASS
jgi:hypothetical protein